MDELTCPITNISCTNDCAWHNSDGEECWLVTIARVLDGLLTVVDNVLVKKAEDRLVDKGK